MTVWPMAFAPQRCGVCGEPVVLTNAVVLVADDDRFDGWRCTRCAETAATVPGAHHDRGKASGPLPLPEGAA